MSEGYSKGLYIMVNNYFLNRQVNNKGPSNTAHMSFDITKHTHTHTYTHTRSFTQTDTLTHVSTKRLASLLVTKGQKNSQKCRHKTTHLREREKGIKSASW